MEDEIYEDFEPPQADYDEAGVDLTVVRESLAMTPAERLQVLQEMMNFTQRVLELNGRL
jgi:hypothetical protein